MWKLSLLTLQQMTLLKDHRQGRMVKEGDFKKKEERGDQKHIGTVAQMIQLGWKQCITSWIKGSHSQVYSNVRHTRIKHTHTHKLN